MKFIDAVSHFRHPLHFERNLAFREVTDTCVVLCQTGTPKLMNDDVLTLDNHEDDGDGGNGGDGGWILVPLELAGPGRSRPALSVGAAFCDGRRG